ncbi:MAG: hypothetical protein RLY16_1186 [Bacteroidota bacterium]
MLLLCGWYLTALLFTGCAQIGVPTGGPRDTIAPKLVNALPAEKTIRFNGKKIVLVFDEYVDVKDVQNALLVSPYPKRMPEVTSKLKTVTIKLKDTLLENTTYAIHFGNSIVDNNEGNPFKDYTYVFSTGNNIDSFRLTGKIILAETGKADSTIQVLLYRNKPDTAILQQKPDFLTRLNREGVYEFSNLAAGNYFVFGLKDGDGSKTYNAGVELFAFQDSVIVIEQNQTTAPTMLAFATEKEKEKAGLNSTEKPTPGKSLKFTHSLSFNTQSLLDDLRLTFNRKIKKEGLEKITLTDTAYKPIKAVQISLDSTGTIASLQTKWQEAAEYRLIIPKEAATDTANNTLLKSDTLVFKAKSKEDYGSLLFRFVGLDTAKHPVLQFFQNEKFVRSVVLTGTQWSDKLVEPGEYQLRILYDNNRNGRWDPGDFRKHTQPEKVIALEKILSVKANWDNEREIQLTP